MAEHWIAIRVNLADDPAVVKMAAGLPLADEDHVVGKLVRLWGWANEHLTVIGEGDDDTETDTEAEAGTKAGTEAVTLLSRSLSRSCHAICHAARVTPRGSCVAPGVSTAWLDRKVGVQGFADALIKVGWLVATPDGLIFPKFNRFNAQTAKTRLLSARRQQQIRADKTNVTPMSRSQRDKKRYGSATKSVTEARQERDHSNSNSIESDLSTDHSPASPQIDPAEPSETSPETPSKRNVLWDTLCELWGLRPVTQSDKSRLGRIVRDLKLKGATPDDLRTRRERYLAAWPAAECSPEALVKHWDRFATETEANARSVHASPARISPPPGKYTRLETRYHPESELGADLPAGNERGPGAGGGVCRASAG